MTKKIIITSPINPALEMVSEEAGLKYRDKLIKLSFLELCAELSNVMAAKHNEMSVPADLGNYKDKQKIVTDLTDKASLICLLHFGTSKIMKYCDRDEGYVGMNLFNLLVNQVDQEVAELDFDGQMQPEEHGILMFGMLEDRLDDSDPEIKEDNSLYIDF